MSVTSVITVFMPALLWAGKFAFIVSVTFWAASAWMFAYLIKYSGDLTSTDANHITALMVRRAKRFIRTFGAISAFLGILLMIEIYSSGTFSFTYLSFSLSSVITVLSYLVVAEFLLVPALTRYEYLNRYITDKNVKEMPVHTFALNTHIRRLCYYQLIPALFVILTVSFQYSLY